MTPVLAVIFDYNTKSIDRKMNTDLKIFWKGKAKETAEWKWDPRNVSKCLRNIYMKSFCLFCLKEILQVWSQTDLHNQFQTSYSYTST